MQIAVDATALLTERSGIGEFVLGLLSGLELLDDLEVSAFAVTWRGRHQLATRVPSGITVCDRVMPARPLHTLWRHVPLPPIEMFIGQVDVVHGTNAVLPPAWRAGGVVTVHDLGPALRPDLVEPNFLPFTELLEKAIRRGAFVHTPSEYVRHQVVDFFGLDPERVAAVPLGLPTRIAGSGDDFGTEPGTSPVGVPEPFVLAVGTVQPRKGYPTLLRAFDLLAHRNRSVSLVIAGQKGWGFEEFDAVLSELESRDRVHYLGYVTAQRRERLLRSCSVLAFPSLDEGFGLPPLEAMAEGVPVVATAAGSIPEVTGDAALLVPVGDAEALAGELERLLEDDTLRSRMITRGRLRAGEYTWERTAEGLRALYRRASSSS